MKDPVVVKAGSGDYRMLYTGVETLEGKLIERVGYATSADGITWTKRGVVLDPSLNAYAADETGIEPTGMLIDGWRVPDPLSEGKGRWATMQVKVQANPAVISAYLGA